MREREREKDHSCSSWLSIRFHGTFLPVWFVFSDGDVIKTNSDQQIRHYSDTIHHLPGAAQKHGQHLHLPHIDRKAHVLGRKGARNTLLWYQKESIHGKALFLGDVCKWVGFDWLWILWRRTYESVMPTLHTFSDLKDFEQENKKQKYLFWPSRVCVCACVHVCERWLKGESC